MREKSRVLGYNLRFFLHQKGMQQEQEQVAEALNVALDILYV